LNDNWSLSACKGWSIIALCLLISTLFVFRLKLRYLFIFDSVNFALALQNFNVGVHQPQPPGDPGFVLLSRLLHRVIPDPVDVFFSLGVLASATAAWLIAKLGDVLSGAKSGIAAAVLLIFNTGMTSSIVISPVRNFLAISSALVAWLAWLTWTRPQPRVFFILTVASLGLCSSFRPELALTLMPVVLFAAIGKKIQARYYALAAAIFAITILAWLYPTARPVGGLRPYFEVLRVYFVSQARATIIGNSHFAVPSWIYMIWRAIIWTFTGALTWMWLLPFVWRSQSWLRDKMLVAFLACWLLPSFLFYCFLHIEHAGHALVTIAGVCLVGGLVLSAIRPAWLFVLTLALVAVLNVEAFKHPFLPDDEANTVSLQALNKNWSKPLEELRGLLSYKHLFIATDSSGLSWRTIRYYLPDTPMLLFERGVPGAATLFPGNNRLERLDKVAKIPSCGKIAWLVGDTAHVPAQISRFADSDWNGSVYLTNGAPGVTLTVNGMTIESDSSLCSK
jgi:hypothetical protein